MVCLQCVLVGFCCDNRLTPSLEHVPYLEILENWALAQAAGNWSLFEEILKCHVQEVTTCSVQVRIIFSSCAEAFETTCGNSYLMSRAKSA